MHVHRRGSIIMTFTANFNSSIVGTDPSATQQATIASTAQSNLVPYLMSAATSDGLASGTCLLGNFSFNCSNNVAVALTAKCIILVVYCTAFRQLYSY